MNKKGLLIKIFLGIVIALVILGIIIGVTVYQGYRVYKTFMEEKANIDKNVIALDEAAKNGDCSKVTNIKASITRIKNEVESACKNPILKMSIDRVKQIPYKCSDIPALESAINSQFAPAEALCANFSSSNPANTTQVL